MNRQHLARNPWRMPLATISTKGCIDTGRVYQPGFAVYIALGLHREPIVHAELENLIARFNEELSTIDEMVHILLKGHLLIEEHLGLLIEQLLFHREHLSEARLTFAQKIHIACSMCLRKNEVGEWKLILSINNLRNDLAHKLQSPEREKKLAKVKSIFFQESAGNPHLAELKAMQDHEIMAAACAHCAGFLASATTDLRALRGMIHTIDRSMNPEQPGFVI